ncbi:hypothetical protein HUJ04_009982 [Dendroctonus ponderosae]|nr:hypothetical protein HUJ04_009982 [Dendroctonus ponderosae]
MLNIREYLIAMCLVMVRCLGRSCSAMGLESNLTQVLGKKNLQNWEINQFYHDQPWSQKLKFIISSMKEKVEK